jgi:hypothetical protein
MQHNAHHNDELVDLGSVEACTRGPGGDQDDFIGGLRHVTGIADE